MTLDLSNKNLKKLDRILLRNLVDSAKFTNVNEDDSKLLFADGGEEEKLIVTLILDNNHLSKLENLEKFVNLRNVSINYLILIK
jgi:hypothetical protein